MPFSHVAFAVRDLAASHRFYAELLGFPLVHVEVIATPGRGWARHVFYDTGGGELLALFDLHDESLGPYRTDLSTGLGLPEWVNHVAFAADGLDALERCRERLLDAGHDCLRIDHGVSVGLYAKDPDGILVELSVQTRPIATEENRRRAHALLEAERPPLDPGPRSVEAFAGRRPAAARRGGGRPG